MAKILVEAIELLMALVMLISGSMSGFIAEKNAIPEPKELSEILSVDDGIFGDIPIADTVYVARTDGLSFNERISLTCLEGIVNREKVQLIVPGTRLDNEYLTLSQEKYGFTTSLTDSEGKAWSLWTLVQLFKDSISNSGTVLYNAGSDANGLNMACVIAGVEGWLPITPELSEKAEAAGLTVRRDISNENYNLSYVKKIFKEYKDVLNKAFVVHLQPGAYGLRDLAIQHKAFVFYVDESTLGRSFRRSVFEWADDNAPVLGWATYERAFVLDISGEGTMLIPSDHCNNWSFYTAFDTGVFTGNGSSDVYTDGTKHYAALVMSDGDNAQYIQNGFGVFPEKTSRSDCDFPMSWTFAPMLQCAVPFAAEYMYSLRTPKDTFISGCSGAGYIELTDYPLDALEGFTDITAAAMYKSDLSVVTILNNLPDDEDDFTHRLGYYARYDNITGGILELDPDRYASGKGRVYFANEKPFVSVRFSLWHESGEKEQVTEEWLREQAEIVNSYPADIDSISGYSVINVHPWSITLDSLVYFVNCLDDDVVLVGAEELINMVQANVPHTNATP